MFWQICKIRHNSLSIVPLYKLDHLNVKAPMPGSLLPGMGDSIIISMESFLYLPVPLCVQSIMMIRCVVEVRKHHKLTILKFSSKILKNIIHL